MLTDCWKRMAYLEPKLNEINRVKMKLILRYCSGFDTPDLETDLTTNKAITKVQTIEKV